MLTQVGKYQIVEKIGVGGFGTVYKGRDPFIKRSVAIKTCQSEEEEIKKRFFREAEFAGNLHHRNVTTIYDFGVTDDGTPYIVQEFLTGDDLDKAIKKKEPLTLQRKLQILIDVCDGLGYAHAAGIIHRDIKPSNIRILEDGTVKIMDFGIAKSMVSQSTLTQTGITLGTASYLAPEQIRGEDLDPRTDIFSLGVLAYEMLTGQKPFTGDHISTVLYKIMNEPPAPPSSLDPALPARPRRHDPQGSREGPHEALLVVRRAARRVHGASPERARGARVSDAGRRHGKDARDADVGLSGHGFRVAPNAGRGQVLARPRHASRAGPLAAHGRRHRGRAPPHGHRRRPSRRRARGGRLGPLKVFLAAVVLLAVAGGAWYVAQQRHAVVPAAPTPAPVPTDRSRPRPRRPSRRPPSRAPPSRPSRSRKCRRRAVVTFKSNIYAELSINGKRQTGQPPGGDARHAQAGTVRRRVRRSGVHEGPEGIRDLRGRTRTP